MSHCCVETIMELASVILFLINGLAQIYSCLGCDDRTFPPIDSFLSANLFYGNVMIIVISRDTEIVFVLVQMKVLNDIMKKSTNEVQISK